VEQIGHVAVVAEPVAHTTVVVEPGADDVAA